MKVIHQPASHAGMSFCSLPVVREPAYRSLPCHSQPVCNIRIEARRTFIQQADNCFCRILFVHHRSTPDLPSSSLLIPFFSSMTASARTARQQCVLTLPCEQPIAIAFSATSISYP